MPGIIKVVVNYTQTWDLIVGGGVVRTVQIATKKNPACPYVSAFSVSFISAADVVGSVSMTIWMKMTVAILTVVCVAVYVFVVMCRTVVNRLSMRNSRILMSMNER